MLALAYFGLPTPAVYRELDVHRERHAQDIFPADPRPTVDTDVLQALRAGYSHMLAAAMHNDLQAPPRSTSSRRSARCSNWASRTARSPGSSRAPAPTVAFLAADVDSALELQVALSASRLNVVRATGPVHGARIVGDS